MKKIQKLVIIGGGPAGATASIYSSRYKVEHLVISPYLGGVAREAFSIENWPGIKTISGSDLMENIWNHAKEYKPKILEEEVKEIKRGKKHFVLTTSGGKVIKTKSVIFTGGTQPRRLLIPGEDKLIGRGISYCATCDGTFFRNRIVAVIGGSNSATMAAIELSKQSKKVYVIYRGDKLKGEPIWVDRIKKYKNIEEISTTNVVKVLGKNKVEELELDKEYKKSKNLKVDGVFIEIGTIPSSDLVKKAGVEVDKDGFIIIGSKGNTNIGGFFAAGDTTNGSGGFRQIITSCAEGAIAARGAFEYLNENE
jgi:thioredoxin reductase (NADPH)